MSCKPEKNDNDDNENNNDHQYGNDNDDHNGTDNDNKIDEEIGVMRNAFDESKNVLSFVKIFDHIEDEAKNDISLSLVLVQFQPNDIIVLQGAKADRFYIIVEGSAIVYKTSEHEGAIELAQLGPFDYFGLKALSSNEVHAATVKANTSLRCFEMNSDSFQSLVQPILNDLKNKAAKYNSFVNLAV